MSKSGSRSHEPLSRCITLAPNEGVSIDLDRGAFDAMVGMSKGSGFVSFTHLSMNKSGAFGSAFFFYGSTDTKAFVLQSFV